MCKLKGDINEYSQKNKSHSRRQRVSSFRSHNISELFAPHGSLGTDWSPFPLFHQHSPSLHSLPENCFLCGKPVCSKIPTSALVALSPQPPDEVPADGAEGRLAEERRHELVSVDLVHAAAQCAPALVQQSFLFLEYTFLGLLCRTENAVHVKLFTINVESKFFKMRSSISTFWPSRCGVFDTQHIRSKSPFLHYEP